MDARIPESSRNPIVNEIKGQKKQLMLLNKTDLADPIQTKKWIKYYQEDGIEVLTVEAKDGKGLNQVKAAIKALMAEEFEKLAAKRSSSSSDSFNGIRNPKCWKIQHL